jgi:hypothetical protein
MGQRNRETEWSLLITLADVVVKVLRALSKSLAQILNIRMKLTA